jgi:hypothetical protein
LTYTHPITISNLGQREYIVGIAVAEAGDVEDCVVDCTENTLGASAPSTAEVN